MTRIVAAGRDHVKSISDSHLKGPNSSEFYSESFNYFLKNPLIDVWQDSRYTCVVWHLGQFYTDRANSWSIESS